MRNTKNNVPTANVVTAHIFLNIQYSLVLEEVL